MKVYVAFAAIATAAAIFNLYTNLTAGSTYWQQEPITRVVDADTVDARKANGEVHRIRLLIVDAPELRGGTPETRQKAQEAKAYVEAWVATHCQPAARVRTTKKDRYGRDLADVECSGRNLSQELLDTGHAVRYE